MGDVMKELDWDDSHGNWIRIHLDMLRVDLSILGDDLRTLWIVHIPLWIARHLPRCIRLWVLHDAWDRAAMARPELPQDFDEITPTETLLAMNG